MIVAVILVVAFLLRIQNLDSPLFYDESVYVNLGQHPFRSDFYPDKIFFRHPPLHYLVLWVVGQVSYSEVAMRLPSVFASCGTVAMTYLLGKEFRGRRLGWVAAALVALSTFHQQYSQAATMYAIFGLTMIVTVYGLKKSNDRIIFIGFVASIYSHYFGFYLAPAIALHYVQRYPGQWIRIIKKIVPLALAYVPWIVIMGQGLAYHAQRTRGLHYWDFHITNLIVQASLGIFLGLVFFSVRSRTSRDDRPTILLVWTYIVTALFLIPFHRYLYPFFPILIVLGVSGLADLVGHRWTHGRSGSRVLRRTTVLLCLVGILIPNVEAYGLFPRFGRSLDPRDSIHTQEWKDVVGLIPAGRVATSNVRSLLFYGNLAGLREYETFQFGEKPTDFEDAMAENETSAVTDQFDWVVVQSFERYEPRWTSLAENSDYELAHELSYTKLFRRTDALKNP